jgi:hypothetical protein
VVVPGAEQVGLKLWKRWVLAGRRSQAEPDELCTRWVLRHSWRFKLTFVLALAMFVAAYLFAFHLGSAFAKDPLWKRNLFHAGTLAIVALNGFVVWTAFRERVVFSEEGIRIRRGVRSEASLLWMDIASLGANAEGDEAALKTVTGSKLAFSLYLDGLGTLRQLLERKVPRDRWAAIDPALPQPYATA